MAAKDPQAVFRDAVALAQQGQYEKALQNHLWFHEHALEHNPALAGVRLSFALAAWVELGQKYPKALQALTTIRDAKARAITDGKGSFALFHDVAAISEHLTEGEKTVALFKVIHRAYPELARQCYRVAERCLIGEREYALCAAYVPDALARFEEIRQLFQMKMEIAEGNPLLRSGGLRQYAETSFVAEVCRLIEVLIGGGRRQEAERVQALGLGLCASAEAQDALERPLGHDGEER